MGETSLSKRGELFLRVPRQEEIRQAVVSLQEENRELRRGIQGIRRLVALNAEIRELRREVQEIRRLVALHAEIRELRRKMQEVRQTVVARNEGGRQDIDTIEEISLRVAVCLPGMRPYQLLKD